jgi:glycosyltransferase involved in cell wall biosynthesis
MKKNKNTVSIVIPTFNRADKVSKAINSALAQTYKCEVIIADHGSSDDTPKVVKKYEKKVKYIRKEKDFGPHFCWLDGVINATGEFVHLQYDDDWIEPTFIEECMKLFTNDVGCVFSDANIVNLETNDSYIQYNLGENCKYGIHSNEILEKRIMDRNVVISPACCIFRKTDLIDALFQGQIPLKSNKIYHGVGPDLFTTLLTMIRYKNFGYVNKPLANFGSHEGSITVNAQKDLEKTKRINDAYDMVKVYYLGLKDTQENIKKYEKKLNSCELEATKINIKHILQLRFIIKHIETFIKKFRKR